MVLRRPWGSVSMLAMENRAYAAKGLAALERLWSEAHGQYLCLDRVTGALIDSPSVGGLLAALRRAHPGRPLIGFFTGARKGKGLSATQWRRLLGDLRRHSPDALLIQLEDPDERAFTTDGCPLPGGEVKVVDVDGRSLPSGETGKLMLRAPKGRPLDLTKVFDDWSMDGEVALTSSKPAASLPFLSASVRSGWSAFPIRTPWTS